MIRNIRGNLMDWLDANGKESVHRDLVGGGQWRCIQVQLSKKGEFMDLYWNALCNNAGEFMDGVQSPDDVYDVVTGAVNPTDGKWTYRMRGCDYDGFYESGESGEYDCVQFVEFQKATVAIAHWPDDHAVLMRDSYADGTPCSRTVVLFMADEGSDKKEVAQ